LYNCIDLLYSLALKLNDDDDDDDDDDDICTLLSYLYAAHLRVYNTTLYTTEKQLKLKIATNCHVACNLYTIQRQIRLANKNCINGGLAIFVLMKISPVVGLHVNASYGGLF